MAVSNLQGICERIAKAQGIDKSIFINAINNNPTKFGSITKGGETLEQRDERLKKEKEMEIKAKKCEEFLLSNNINDNTNITDEMLDELAKSFDDINDDDIPLNPKPLKKK